MTFYSSHIYLEAKQGLLNYLRKDPVLSSGLFHLRGSTQNSSINIWENSYPENGILVLREVCDPDRTGNDHDEARVHQNRSEPVLSWWKLHGPPNLRLIYPLIIPTLAFGKIYINHENNPPPPLEFLRFLKHLSLTHQTRAAFYHKYCAYEDELAEAEYAWVFDKTDSVYIKHVDGIYNITEYHTGARPSVIHNPERESYSQPILNLIMDEFGVTLKRTDNNKPYFYDFNWDDYRI